MSLAPRKPRLIPVLDLMYGQVVRAVGGKRNEYQPLTSELVQSTDPSTVAKALLDATRAKEIYVADLDAIMGNDRSYSVVRNLLESLTVPVWLDGGFGEEQEIPSFLELLR